MLDLRFASDPREVARQARARAAATGRTIRIMPASAAAAFRSMLGGDDSVRLVASVASGTEPPAGVGRATPETAVDVIAIAGDDADTVSAALHDCIDLARGTVIAPVTAHHFSRRSLFLISIPKSGSHLLLGLVRALGYSYGHDWLDRPLPQYFYNIARNPHAPARVLAERSLRHTAELRDHPFFRSPAVFIYRDPRDILVSEVNWFPLPFNIPYAPYFAGLSFRERLLRLIDDPWLFGSIRERVGDYIAWLDYPNVIPVSYEELVGPEGGGDAEEQRRAIWSLQLKLHVPGDPEHFAEQVYDRSSRTFHRGRIGAWRDVLDAEARERFAALPGDFMERYGYDPAGGDDPLPAHRHVYRRRRLVLSTIDFSDTPAPVEMNVGGCNIVRFHDRYYALPHNSGIDLTALSDKELAALRSDIDLARLRLRLQLPTVLPEVEHDRAAAARLATPRMLGTCHDYNLVEYRGVIIAAHQSLAGIQWTETPGELVAAHGPERVILAGSEEAARLRIDLLRLEQRLAAIEARTTTP